MRSTDRRFFDLSKTGFPRVGPDLFWMVGMGKEIRHATEVRPGLVPAGDWIPTLCERWIRIPCSTPYGQQPRSKSIDERCPDCERIAAADESSSVNWDF